MALHLDDVTFSYRADKVLRGVTAHFEEGAAVLLGANGAGKSTLLALIASVRQPSTGHISIDGVGSSVARGADLKSYRRAVAWLPQKFSAFPGLRVREHVAYAGWLKGMSKADAWEASAQAIDDVGLSERADDRVKTLSGGQQRRVGIAGALVHDARVILLDEPTAGLDPAQRRKFREVLEAISRDRIVVVSSHDTDDAHSAFDEAAVLREGELVFKGTVADFVSGTPTGPDMRDRVEAAYLRWAGSEG
jgi:ABC-2 type transport system ATP-binding protein